MRTWKTWDDEKLTCIHGVKEKLDYHDCPKCKEMALKKGLEWIDGQKTFLFTKDE